MYFIFYIAIFILICSIGYSDNAASTPKINYCGKATSAKVAADCTKSGNSTHACCLAGVSAGAIALSVCMYIPISATFIIPYIKQTNYSGILAKISVNCGDSYQATSEYRCSAPDALPTNETECAVNNKSSDPCCLFKTTGGQGVCAYKSLMLQNVGGVDVTQAGIDIACSTTSSESFLTNSWLLLLVSIFLVVF
jgi:hypothetical protein